MRENLCKLMPCSSRLGSVLRCLNNVCRNFLKVWERLTHFMEWERGSCCQLSTSAAFLAETSVRSPRKLFIFIILKKKSLFGINVSKKKLLFNFVKGSTVKHLSVQHPSRSHTLLPSLSVILFSKLKLNWDALIQRIYLF